MGNLYKPSNASIRVQAANYPVWVIEAANPEVILGRMLSAFFLEMRFKDLYPNFGDIRIGTIHPFAMLLFQDVMGEALDLSVFPSITVSDTTENEDFMTLGHDTFDIPIDALICADMDGYVQSGKFTVNPTSWGYVKAAVALGPVVGTKTSYRGQHSIDLNIWTENRDLTSMIYDLVKAFVNSQRNTLHNHGIDIVGALSGRRSGDISVEFGKMLHGGNLTIPAVIDCGAMRIDLSTDVINHINVSPEVYGHYHVVEEVGGE